jgi:putative oxidoreductase
MVVAWITAHRTNGFFIFKPGQGWEYVMIVTFVAIVLGTLGPGEWSLDHALDLDWNGWSGMLTVLLAGIGGALVLLAAAWRPERGGDG